MGKIAKILSLVLLTSASALAQSGSYEYWLDDDKSSLRSGVINTTRFNLTPDVSELQGGAHYFNLRIRNEAGEWGSTYRMIFFKPSEPAADVTGFEYWIDNDYEAKVAGGITSTTETFTPDVSSLESGAHFFNYRLRNDAGAWGAVYRQMFFKVPGTSESVTGYEYWVDNNYSERRTGSLNGNSIVFDVNLDEVPKKMYNFFNFRLRNDKGDWGSTYRKMFVFYDSRKSGAITGYRHNLNGEDLGYVEVTPQPSNIYTFTVDLTEGAGIHIADAAIRFNGDNLIVEQSDSIDYRIQIKSDTGWAPPTQYAFEAGIKFSTTAEQMRIPSTLTFTRPMNSEFKAVKFNSDGNIIYAHLDRRATMDIYSNGIKTMTVAPEELLNTKVLTLAAGTYYAVIHTVEKTEGNDDVTFSLDNTILDAVKVEYNGRYATLIPPTDGAEIFYTLDGSSPENGIRYETTFDVGGLATIRTFAKAGDDYISKFDSYNVTAYADEHHAETSAPGLLQHAFQWDENFPREVETYAISGPLNDEDFRFIRTMSSLEHLDMSLADVNSVPDNAFSGMDLISIILPDAMKEYGDGLFSGCHRLSAMEYNALNTHIDKKLTASVSNPNLILYLSNRVSVSVDESINCNVVRGQFANNLQISDGYPFYVPKQFIANEVSFTRNFSKTSGYDYCAGWETIVLPFDVQTIRDEYSEIYPFAADSSGDRRFWLYSPSADGWLRSSTILAYQPYLIAMPNNYWYAEDMIIKGDVVFQSKNVEIAATPDAEGLPFKNGIWMYPTFMPASSGEDFYTINNEVYEGNAPGSVFVKNLRDAIPFECYLTAANQPKMIPVMESSDVETITLSSNLKVWTEQHDICIYSDKDSHIRLFDTLGNLVRIAEVKADEVCRVSDLYKGIYIIANKKISIKN